MKPGDWRCPNCNFHNFARRNNCKSCEDPKPEGIESTGDWGGYEPTVKPGDWSCGQCGFLNFARRVNCRQCQSTRPEGLDSQDYMHSKPASYEQTAKPGDWTCDGCLFLNFARRRFCKECGTQRPSNTGESFAAGGGHGERRSGTWMESRPGDWACESCNFNNFARRSHCKECGSARPDGFVFDPNEAQNNAGAGRPGDWNCSSCNYLNFARRVNCGRCGEVKE